MFKPVNRYIQVKILEPEPTQTTGEPFAQAKKERIP